MKHFDSKSCLSGALLGSLLVLLTLFAFAVYDYIQIKDISPEYVEPKTFLSHLYSDEVFAICKTADSDFIQFQLVEDVPTDLRQYCFEKKRDILLLDSDAWYETYVYDSTAFSELLTTYGVIVSDMHLTEFNTYDLMSTAKLLMLIWLCAVPFLMLSSVNGRASTGAFSEKYTVCTTSNYTFNDVIGHDEIISDIKDYISILKNTEQFKEKNIRQPKGILFSGPPGTGKTLIAKALAGEAKVPFIYFNSASAIDMYVGAGARAIRGCFAKARKLAPCVLFIDELDAVGKGRGSKTSRSTEDDQTLLALLQELDGFTETAGILVIGATNCVDHLDSALLRAGRFDRHISIKPPRDRKSRIKLLEHYTKQYHLAEDVKLSDIAAQMQGFTGADISAICNEAAIIATIRDANSAITANDFALAFDKYLLKGNRISNSETNSTDQTLVAYHEAGHAVAVYLTGGTISRISIHNTTSGVGGYVLEEDKPSLFTSKQELYNRILILYAGRASEQIQFGENCVSSGAANDIQQATETIENMLLAYGYDSEIGLLDYSRIINLGLADKGDIVRRMQKLSCEFYDKTLELLQNNFTKVHRLAETLLQEEELDGNTAISIIESEEINNE